MRHPLACLSHRVRDAASRDDVVILNQHAIEKAEPVVMPPTDAHGVFLHSTPPRRCLPRIHDFDIVVCNGVDKLRGERGDTGKPLEEVERGAFAYQDCLRATLHLGDSGACNNFITIVDERAKSERCIEAVKDARSDRQPGDNTTALGNDCPNSLLRRGDCRLGSDVADADVLREGEFK